MGCIYLIKRITCIVIFHFGMITGTLAASSFSEPNKCQFDYLKEAETIHNSQRKLALIIGVSSFKGIKAPLTYTDDDARDMYDLLVNYYDFQEKNICLLINDEATLANARHYLEKMASLLRRQPNGTPDDKKDVAIFYISSHGSQVYNHPLDQDPESGLDIEDTDTDGFGRDSTLMLYDSWSKDDSGNIIWDLVDDEMYNYLGNMLMKTPNVVMIADTCHSGSSAKSPEEIGTVKKISLLNRPKEIRQSKASSYEFSETDTHSRLVYMGASADGKLAHELSSLKNGVFTDAILEVAKKIHKKPLTYNKLRSQVLRKLDVDGREQIPVINADGELVVFGSKKRIKPPNSLNISKNYQDPAIDSIINLISKPLIGLGEGSVLNVFDGAITAQETLDKKNIKAQLLVTQSTSVETIAKVKKIHASALERGDYAVMIKSSNNHNKLKVKITSLSKNVQPQLIDNFQSKIKAEIQGRSKLAENIEFVKSDADVIVNTKINIDDLSENAYINTLFYNNLITVQGRNEQNIENIISNKLEGLVIHKQYLTLKGYTGETFEDDETLAVRVQKRKLQSAPGKKSLDKCFNIQKWNEEQRKHFMELEPEDDDGTDGTIRIPVCMPYRVNIKNNSEKFVSGNPTPPLFLGMVRLDYDGEVKGYPKKDNIGHEAKVKPGKNKLLPLNDHYIMARKPGVTNRFIIFGTQDKREDWYTVGQTTRDTYDGSDKDIETQLEHWTMTTFKVEIYDPFTTKD